MAVSEARFDRDLKMSNDAVLVVAAWLLYECGVEATVPDPPHPGRDHGDLYVGGNRYEVKWRHDRPEFHHFTGESDYPYGDVLVCEDYRYPDTTCTACGMDIPAPSAIFNVSGDLKNAVVAYAAMDALWWLSGPKDDSRYGNKRQYWHAPFKACRFYDIRA